MKKFVSLFLALTMLFSVFGFSTVQAIDIKSGDVNLDGEINAADALNVLQFSIGRISLGDTQKSKADVNGDGLINSSDALVILQISVGLKPSDGKTDIDFSAYPTLDTEWMDTVVNNYNEFISEVQGDSTRIPMIVSTDQHGTVTTDCEVFKFINDLVDWNDISKIISLGDTVYLTYSKAELKAYDKAVECLPVEKRLELFGNHDGHISAIHRDMTKYFVAYGAEYTLKKDAFVVEDEQFNVRYLSIDPMGYPWTYTSGKINTAQANFIIEQLEKEDDMNVVLLSHPYLFRDELIKRDGTTFTGSETFIGDGKKGADVKQSFLDMLLARKNKTAGVFVDSNGIKHSYDFTNCKGDFLMALHGHHHTEGYETSNGITEFLFQSFKYDEPNCFYFAYIDTDDMTFKCWKNIPGYDAWEIEIA